MPPNAFINSRSLSILYLSLIILTYVAGFSQSIDNLVNSWSSGDDSYCFLVFPVFIYLCWRKREHFKFFEFSWSPMGILPLLLSVTLILTGDISAVKTFQHLGHWLFVVGLVITVYGRRARMLTFPLLILFFIVPLPPYVNRVLTFKLKLISSHIAAEMFKFFNIAVFQDGNILDLGVQQLQVVEACSGLRYFMPMILMLFMASHFLTHGFWRKAVLFSSVLPLLLLTNAFRVFLTGMLIINDYASIAEGLSHDVIGLFVFLLSCLFLVGLAFTLKNTGQKPIIPESKDPGAKTFNPIASFVLVIFICLVFFLSSWALKQIPSLLIQPPRKTFESFPMKINDWNGNKLSLPNNILKSLGADDYISANYEKENTENIVYLLISFYSYQITNHTAHTPQTCILGSGWTLQYRDEKTLSINPDKKIGIKVMVLEKGENQVLGSYFFFQRGRVITNPWLNKFYIFWDAVVKRRTDGALVRVEMKIKPGQSLDDASVLLEEFILNLWPLLNEYLPS